MRVRVRENRLYSRFRRVGHTFTPEWQDVDPSTLTPQARELLLSDDSRRYLEFEGAPAEEHRGTAEGATFLGTAAGPAPSAPSRPPAKATRATKAGKGGDE